MTWMMSLLIFTLLNGHHWWFHRSQSWWWTWSPLLLGLVARYTVRCRNGASYWVECSSASGCWPIFIPLQRGWWVGGGGRLPLCLCGPASFPLQYRCYGFQSILQMQIRRLAVHSLSLDQQYSFLYSTEFSQWIFKPTKPTGVALIFFTWIFTEEWPFFRCASIHRAFYSTSFRIFIWERLFRSVLWNISAYL